MMEKVMQPSIQTYLPIFMVQVKGCVMEDFRKELEVQERMAKMQQELELVKEQIRK